jgi:signal transduction histidine kinase
LIVVLLVPLLTAVGLGALRVVNQLQSATVYHHISQEVALSTSLSSVIDSVQREAEQVTLFSAANSVGQSAGSGPGSAQTDQVDAAVSAFTTNVRAATGLNANTQTAMTNAENALADLQPLRSSAASTKFPEVDVLAEYNTILTTLLNSTQVVEAGAADQSVYQLSNSLTTLRQAKEDYSQINAILMMTLELNQFPAGEQDALRADDAQFTSLTNTYNNEASAADQEMLSGVFTGPSVDQRASELAAIEQTVNPKTGALNGTSTPIAPTDVQNYGDASSGLLRKAEQNLQDELNSSVNSLGTSATNQAVRDGLLVAALLVLAFLITLLVARAIVLSLRRLRAGALEVARVRLPESVQRILADPDPIRASSEAVEPIPVFTADEIGEVARSFDVVHGQAIRLAAEQAVLRDNVNAIFVNLSRRSQALVERQLALIDRLERDEQDPDQLANLFELDHLATRMRRNSESLLVLSGSGLAKRMSRPVPIGELVGAAVSEVEQYARVEVGSPPETAVLGRAVNDLIHLIAELLDNATTYSEPNTKVSVRIAKTKSRELAIQITDRGVGMSEEDARSANENLANPPDIDVSVTRRMGLYVVARLAKRHGIRIKLRTNEDIDGGTVALVVIPEALIHRPGEDPAGPVVLGGLDAPAPMGARPVEQPNGGLANAAAAAAGIAGAFGLASARPAGENSVTSVSSVAPPGGVGLNDSGVGLNGYLDTGYHSAGTLGGELPQERSGPIAGPNSYWNDSGPSSLDTFAPIESAPQPAASNPTSLWEPYTAADSLPEHPSVLDRGWEHADPSNRTFNGTMDLGTPLGSPPPIEVDAPTERLPIYEAVLSQWFRAEEDGKGGVRPAPAEFGADPVAPAFDLADSGAESVQAAEPAPAPAASPMAEESVDEAGLPTRVPGRAGAAYGFGSVADRLSGHPNGTGGNANGDTSSADDLWQSNADEGWQAAQALLKPVAEKTGAGLPKRTPRAHLVPGSAAPRPEAAQPFSNTSSGDLVGAGAATGGRGARSRPALPPRTADAVRGRMSSFQQGLRRGRHTLGEGYSDEASHSSEHHSVEEQE